ncbi:hypothetical protein PNA2_1286 [Pyrococcus sp. NA2]|uniref:lysine exporter LysO family protein n=1 Tax=Pyrococcus sp. (strain NA2) TaxID=342949 RepID=UPI000209AD56|nr:lysine exporter LysO family protein [Pyrococcus sp. NA2]AEC52201.1 hypothetical protein PNA2_1286 [Pyrococcus sp. NA2]
MFTIIVLIALTIGFILGKLNINPGNSYEIALYALIFVIGLDLGLNAKISDIKRTFSTRVLMLPFATLLGSIIGGAIASILAGISMKWALAISAGVGWYSLTGAVLAQFSPLYGVIGFLANFLREVLTVITYPILSERIGKEVAISIGGATTMDSTLPIIAKVGGKEVSVIAFIHGFVLTLIVPVIVPMIASLEG